MGFQADIIIWDFDNMQLMHRLKLHKVLIKSLSFSFNDNYLISVGGQDDNTIVLWEVETGKALSGNSSGSNKVSEIRFYNSRDDKFLTVHEQQVKLWCADITNKKMKFTDVAMGQLKRTYLTACIDPSDTFAYIGTKTGDIIEVYLEKANFKRLGPVKRLFSQGIICIDLLSNGDILLGSGDGTVAKVGQKDLKVKR